MALKFEVNKNDLKNLRSKILKLDELTKRGLKRELQRAASNAVQRMKAQAPVDTGRLRNNIHHKVTSRGVEIQSEAIDPVNGVDYAPIQEYGTRFSRATPYFHRNIKKMVNELYVNISRRVDQIINRK